MDDNGPSTDEQTVERVMQLGFAFQGSAVLLSALQLDLFTQLDAGSRTLPVLSSDLELAAAPLSDLLDALVELGLLVRREGEYANSDVAKKLLVQGRRGYVGGLLSVVGSRLYDRFGSLTALLKTGRPQSPESKEGENIFVGLASDPAAHERWVVAMSNMVEFWGRPLLSKLPWSSCSTFIDVGGAEGALSVLIAEAFPHLRGGSFDLPAVRPFFDKFVATNGLSERLRFHDGDFKKDSVPSADIVVCAHIMHSESIETRRALLGKVHASLRPNGTLAVVDMMVQPGRRGVPALCSSLGMRLESTDGFESDVDACARWLTEAGFVDVHSDMLPGFNTLLVGKKV